MNVAMMSQPERVSTEAYVERTLVRHDGPNCIFRFQMKWEGTVIAQAHVSLPSGASAREIDSAGMTQLLRALTSV